MKYHKFGRLDWEVSVLGLSATQLPPVSGNSSRIGEREIIKMLRYALDQGVNYLDLGCPYYLKQQEILLQSLSKALKDGYREKTRITASCPSSLIKSTSDFDRHLDSQLEWLQVPRFDFFLIGGLNRETWPKMQDLSMLRWVEKAMGDGKVSYFGFSFHDQYQFLRNILEAYDNWTLCQFQYSYMDVDHHPGVSGLKLAADKGLAVVVSEPLKSGRLTKPPPEPVAGIWDEAPTRRSLAEWGLRWVWNHPEVSTVVVDMSSFEQIKEYISPADSAQPNSLSIPEEVVISRVREQFRKLRPVNCTTCRSCMPCPQGIDVPRIFELYNDAFMYDDCEIPRSTFTLEQHCIENCNECGICMKTCGREIQIPDHLQKAKQLFTSK
jgi:uncharacterized protein